MPFPYTIADIEAAAERTGLKVTDGTFCSNNGHCGCPLYILAVDKDAGAVKRLKRKDLDSGDLAVILDLTYLSSGSFICGFDGHPDWDGVDETAFNAGVAARAHFILKEPTP